MSDFLCLHDPGIILDEVEMLLNVNGFTVCKTKHIPLFFSLAGGCLAVGREAEAAWLWGRAQTHFQPLLAPASTLSLMLLWISAKPPWTTSQLV